MHKKHFSKFKEPLAKLPDLVESQMVSFDWLIKEGIEEVLKEFSPISDYSGKKFELYFEKFKLEEAPYDEYYAKENKVTYEAPLRINVKLKNKILGTEKNQEIFMTDFPLMTNHGTFIINGVERVFVPQLIRSFGVLFTMDEVKGKKRFGAKIIPSRGAWIEIETSDDSVLYIRIDKKRKIPATALLRILGARTNDEILALFNSAEAKEYIQNTLDKDISKNQDDSYIELYRRLRDGEMATAQNARELIDTMFSDERYDLSVVGRFRFNDRFGLDTSKKALEKRVISIDDLAIVLEHIVKLNTTADSQPDDIDHLGWRRVRYVGEMLQQKMRVGMSQVKRNIQDRMSTIDTDMMLPINVISPRPLQARVKEFFATNQLSQFMQQENVLHELEHLRTLSALGPGGLSRERAGFEVRDVHPSHYGRVCPVHTPEGPNIGLILRLAAYSQINDLGMIETPYAKVKNGKITSDIVYLNALEEESHSIAHAATEYDSKTGEIKQDMVEVRLDGKPSIIPKKDVEYIDVATNQAFSLAPSMIPFLNHDDANRALMGSNMQKQATPCIKPEAPIVATGIEEKVARDSGRLVYANEAGTVTEVDSRHVVVKDSNGKSHKYDLINFSRTNSFTAFHHRPIVDLGEKVKKGQLLADTSSTDNGETALGQNMLVAFMSWSGSNYEDAIIISERVAKQDRFTSIHVEEFSVSVRDTKLGPEVTTPDIPNVSESKLRNLDESGIVRIGAEVRPGDFLVGKVTPKGESQLTPEERLLRSIFGEKAKEVKDTSLRMDNGKRGRVIGVKVFSREQGHTMQSGIIKQIFVEVAQFRNVSVGDKLAGRHGNKGVIARILPEEDMPYAADGRPIDVILTPLGVPSRMNLGQILELHLGMAAHTLGYQAIVPPFAGATDEEIKNELEEAGFPRNGKIPLYDGRTGEKFDQDIAVGYMYIMKLHHMVEDKLHMRSIGPYSLITQQPLGGKAMAGGQRFGEMEVWALLGYGVSYILREVLTVKSDDIIGRSMAFDAIVRGENIKYTNIPASFNVLMNNLRSLSLDISLESSEDK
jgi:DNA-directed RNA polymerase subunit beta